MKKMTISLNDDAVMMLEDIKRRANMPSLNAAIGFSIFEAHRGMFPAYLMNKGAHKNKEEREVEKKEEVENEQKKICDALGGTIGKDGVCTYYTYQLRKRYEQRVAVGLLHPDYIESQYDPSRKVVENLKEEGKTDW